MNWSTYCVIKAWKKTGCACTYHTFLTFWALPLYDNVHVWTPNCCWCAGSSRHQCMNVWITVSRFGYKRLLKCPKRKCNFHFMFWVWDSHGNFGLISVQHASTCTVFYVKPYFIEVQVCKFLINKCLQLDKYYGSSELFSVKDAYFFTVK